MLRKHGLIQFVLALSYRANNACVCILWDVGGVGGVGGVRGGWGVWSE
jgi:hypothetical protein